MMPFKKFLLPCCALALTFAIFPCPRGFARPAVPADDQTEISGEADEGTSPSELAAQVREISGSSLISRAKKEKRISTAVRVAVVSATAYNKDPDQVLSRALALAEAAARAAPHYAEVIANSVSYTSAVARIDGAAGRIRTATFAAAKGPRTAHTSTKKPRAPVHPAEETTTEPETEPAMAAAPAADTMDNSPAEPPPARVARPAREEAQDSLPNTAYVADSTSASMDDSTPWPKIMLGDSTSMDLTAALGIRHDDNIFVTSENKVGAMIYTFTPGVAVNFGLQSLAHGSFNYNESFVRYADSKAPNANLGSGAADFGYDTGSLTLAASASFQQLYQNENVQAGLEQQQQIYRRDLTNVALSVETELSAKTRLKTGANYDRTEYKTEGLVGTAETSVPVNLYYATTPKTSLSVGATYRYVKPQGDGPSGHDLYYNVGARGDFTSKLSGEFSVGYRNRDVGANPAENLWGFDGNLKYELTPKTNLALLFTRDFSTGALGESLKNNRYTFRLSADPAPEWSFAASLSYEDSDYGPNSFSVDNVPVTVTRKDQYWQGDLTASYLFTHWLSLTLEYTLRDNHSTLSQATYSNNIFSLLLSFRY